MKKIFRSSLAFFLAILMLCSIMAVGVVTTSATVIKGINVTVKSRQNAFEDISRVYQKGEVFELTINWRNNGMLINNSIDTFLNCEGLRVIEQDVNPKIPTGALATNIDESCQIQFGLVTLNFSFLDGIDWSTEDYIVKYKVMVLEQANTQETLEVDFKETNGLEVITVDSSEEASSEETSVTDPVDDTPSAEASEPSDDSSTEEETKATETKIVELKYISNSQVVEENKDKFTLSTVLSEPAPVVKEYTIVGNINGKDVGFDSDDQTVVPEYTFVDGKVTIPFSRDSYVFVKTTNNYDWYMCEGYCQDTSVVLHDTTVEQLNDPNKMFVPAGIVTFTLVENEDGTISLSYEADTSSIPTEPEPVDKEYTIVGYINGNDVGCNDDDQTIVPEYTFVDGTVIITFEEDSWIFIKTTNTENTEWYMTESLCEDISATFVNTSTGTSEKMYVPAGTLKFTLIENEDESLTLSYIPYEDHETSETVPIPDGYTIVGYINGVDVGCEDDHKTVVPEYVFVDGKVTIEFDMDSYVFIKTTDNQKWYMFASFSDNRSSGVLYDTTTGTYEKMYVPAGKVTFTLVENADGSLTLSYVPYEEPESESSNPTEKPTVTEPTQPATKKPSIKVAKKTLKAGQQTTVTVKNAGKKKVTYKSLNPKVATVSSKGVVKALGKGAAKITATVKGYGKLTCKVTVKTSPKLYKGKKAIKKNKTYTVKKGKTLTLKIKGKAAGVNNSYKTGNKKIAKVTSKNNATKIKIKGYKKGTAKITVTVNKNYKTTFKVKVK